jgi:hypothetical protein
MIEMFGDVQVVVAETATGATDVGSSLLPTAGVDLAPMKRVVAAIATGFSEELRNLNDLAPDEIEVNVKLTLSEELKAWVVGVKGDQTFSLTLKWKGGHTRS